MEKQVRLAAVGDNCIDFYDRTGEAYPGGNPVNVAVYTVRMGGCASYTGVVGSDDFGELMRRAIAEKGVDVSHLRTEEGATAVTHVELDERGDRVLGDYDEGVMEHFALTEEDLDFLAGHDLVVSGLWGRVEGALPRLKERGVEIAFDFADKPLGDIAQAALPWTDYAFFSNDGEDEAALQAFLRKVVALGPKVAVVTRGEAGSLAYDGKAFYRGAIVPCHVEDTMGAGDSYIAGFLFGAMRGEDIPRCMELGAKSSAVTLGYFGAW